MPSRPEQQARALGIWAAVSAIALAVGPLIGGLLIEAASWRWIFFINVPVAAAGIAILLARGEESRDPEAPRRVDLAGVVVLAVGLTAVVFGLVEADEWGWGSARTLALLGGGGAVLCGFWLLERRREDPLVDFSLFRNRPYLGASAAAFALVGSYWAVMFFQPQYLQDELGYSAAAAGAMVLPITAPMVAFSPFSGRLIDRLGPRLTMTAGMLFGIAGLVLQALAEDSASYLALLPGFLCFGIALALVYAPMSVAAMAAMPRSKAGIASGVLAMVRVLAGALLLAVSSAIFQSALPDSGSPRRAAADGSCDRRCALGADRGHGHRHGADLAPRPRPGRAAGARARPGPPPAPPPLSPLAAQQTWSSTLRLIPGPRLRVTFTFSS